MISSSRTGTLVILDAGAATDNYQSATVAASGVALKLPKGRYRMAVVCDAGNPMVFLFNAAQLPPSQSPKATTQIRTSLGPNATIFAPLEFEHTDSAMQLAFGFVDPSAACRYVVIAITSLE